MQKHLSYLLLAISFFSTFASACSTTTNDKESSAAAANQVSGMGNQAVVEASPTVEQKDIFSKFKVEDDYRKTVRPQIVKDGWVPARTEDGDANCASGMDICKELPELEAGPSSPAGDAILRWKKGDKVVRVFTFDNELFKGYEYEKTAAKASEPNLPGKYVILVVGFSGEHTLELKADKTAAFKVLEEDGESTGAGTWSWDKAKDTVTVALTITTEIAGTAAGEGKPEVAKASFQLKPAGKDLKVVKDTWSPEAQYVGRVFKRS